MGHRLRLHNGVCKNLHGHSYKLIIELTGNQNQSGMLIDFYDLDKLIQPIVSEFDHGFFVAEEDTELAEVLSKLNSKMIIQNFEPTAESLSGYLVEKIANTGLPENIEHLLVRVFESEESFAEAETYLRKDF